MSTTPHLHVHVYMHGQKCPSRVFSVHLLESHIVMCLHGSHFAHHLQAAPPIITNNIDLACFER